MPRIPALVRQLAATASLLALSAIPAHAVDLTGQSICATWGTTASNGLADNPFSCPATVGAGTEFAGGFTDVFGQVWVFGVDVFATGFSLKIDTPTFANGNVSSGSALNLTLTGLSGIGPISLADYDCEPETSFACGTFGNGPSIQALTSDATSAFVDLSSIRNGETYVFSFNGGTPVPEPGTFLLLIGGVAALGVRAGVRRTSTRA